MIRKFVGIILVLLNCNISEASLIKVEFSGSIHEVHESIKNINSTGYTHINKTQSFMLGDPIAIGDLVNGWFIYDTLAPETSYSQTQTSYENVKLYNAITSWGYSVSSYNISESEVNESIQIWDDNDCCNWDVFYSSLGLRVPSFFTNMTFRLYDKTGSAFSNMDIPDTLNKDDFHLHEVHAGYIPTGSQDQLHWTADISTLSVNKVPEPSTIWLFLITLVCFLKINSRVLAP